MSAPMLFSISVLRNLRKPVVNCCRNASSNTKGLVLGLYENETVELTKAAETFNQSVDGKLTELLNISSKVPLKKGKCRTFHGLSPAYNSVTVVSLGKRGVGYNDYEEWEEGRENIRTASAAGVRQLRDLGVRSIVVDPCGDAEAAAEGANLALFSYDELKAEDKRKKPVNLELHSDTKSCLSLWKQGTVKAEGQNLARKLMEMPSNILTPTKFADIATEHLGQKCEVRVRNKEWITSQEMGAFLSVTQGSSEPPIFLEIEYNNSDNKKNDQQPVALVGKGVTFDTGGISIKPAASMDLMRGDMGGAACVLGALYSLSKLQVPTRVIAFIPLCENMPSGTAVKPGDVVRAMNGKTIQVDNTDAEGRLILADALCYAETFNPNAILDMATLTGAIDVALGSGATGVFTNSTSMWNVLHKAGVYTGDRVWRMPLWQHYISQVTDSKLADVNNIGKVSRSGGACTAAAFLKEFVTNKNWCHLDIAGVMSNKDEVPYIGSGMTGRPTRTIIEYLMRQSDSSS